MSRLLVPLGGMAVLTGLATLLIWKIVLLSPDSHAHLWETWRTEYTRTPPIFVGQEAANFELARRRGHASAGDSVSLARGRQIYLSVGNPVSLDPGREIYLSAGCGTCHGLDALGGPVAPALADTRPQTLERMVREGPGGMLAYSKAHLSDADLEQIAAYLQGLAVPRRSSQEIAAIQGLRWDPAVPLDVLLAGKAALRRSCGACHTQPTKEEIRSAFGSDYDAASLVADMVYETNLSLEDARAIAYYMLAILNGADPVKTP